LRAARAWSSSALGTTTPIWDDGRSRLLSLAGNQTGEFHEVDGKDFLPLENVVE
jgi:hypothetical protein